MKTAAMWTQRAAIVAASAALIVVSAGAAQAAPGQGGPLRALVSDGVISQAQLDDFRAEKDRLKDEGMTCAEATSAALASLTSSGVLTGSEATAIETAKAAKKAAKGDRKSGRGDRGSRGSTPGGAGNSETAPPVSQ